MKSAMNFSVEPLDGGTLLRTETRVLTTDPASRRAFGRYWLLIKPGSAEVRRGWLRAARRRAECAKVAKARRCMPTLPRGRHLNAKEPRS
jgi:hypothetical protein